MSPTKDNEGEASLISTPTKARQAAKRTSLYRELSNKMAPKRSSTAPTTSREITPGQMEDGQGQEFSQAERCQSEGRGTSGTSNGSQRGIFNRISGSKEINSDDSSGATATGPEDKKKEKTGLFRDPPHGEFNFSNQIRRTLFNSYLNILLLAAPAGIALMYLPIDGKITFAVNFVAIVPLAAILSDCTEEIALRTGELLGGLINATFGNAVELIVAIIALAKNEIRVVQTSLIGSILSNLLLVLGMCFAFGGANMQEQVFNEMSAQTAASLLALAVGSLILPTVFAQTEGITEDSVPKISHGLSVILLIVYGFYMLFQLKTHSDIINVKPTHETKAIWTQKKDEEQAQQKKDDELTQRKNDEGKGEGENQEEEEEEAQLHIVVAFAVLLISTVLIAFCAEGMVGGIEAITAEGVSEEFVGLILVPIVGNACEHATAVTVAMKNKMDLAIGVAIGSSLQVALFLLPLLVIIGWGMGKDEMTLSFDVFQIVVLFVSVLLVNYLIGDGKSHWLEGVMLMCMYFMIATCTWWYPHDYDPSTPGVQSSKNGA